MPARNDTRSERAGPHRAAVECPAGRDQLACAGRSVLGAHVLMLSGGEPPPDWLVPIHPDFVVGGTSGASVQALAHGSQPGFVAPWLEIGGVFGSSQADGNVVARAAA